MLHGSTSSPRRTSNDVTVGTNTEIDPGRGRSQTPRDHQFQQRQRHPNHPSQRLQRPAYKNMNTPADLAPYFPTHIQDHGRWEAAGPRFCGPRRGATDKDAVDLHSLPILKQPHKSIFNDIDELSAECKVSDEKYRIQLRNFPELPQLAHERIREFGNEIVACYPVQLCKFFNDSMIEASPNSFAVFTKKARTAQRWLMVFKCERGRVNVCFNKLLTNQLVVRCLNPLSVEVEPARGIGSTAPHENCVFTFNGHTLANKFVHDIHESQTIVWNHREMFLEQTLRGAVSSADYYIDGPPNMGYYSPRPLSARASSNYFIPADLPPPTITPRFKVLPPMVSNRSKRSPFTVSSRSSTPKADLDENWRLEGLSQVHPVAMADLNSTLQSSPTTVAQSPIRKRSKGSNNKDTYVNTPNSVASGGGEGDFVYNSLTHALALQQNAASKGTTTLPTTTTSSTDTGTSPVKEVSTGRRFQVLDVLVSNKRDVGAGAPDEEFFSLGSGELQMVNNGEENFDEIKCITSAGQPMFSQILFGWNKVRHPEGSQKDSNVRWWIGAAVLGATVLKHGGCGNSGNSGGGDAARIREFKATFSDQDSANKFAELFQEGAVKGNNPDVRKRYLAQSFRI